MLAVGTPLPSIEVCIVDEDGNIIPPESGKSGELQVFGPHFSNVTSINQMLQRSNLQVMDPDLSKLVILQCMTLKRSRTRSWAG